MKLNKQTKAFRSISGQNLWKVIRLLSYGKNFPLQYRWSLNLNTNPVLSGNICNQHLNVRVHSNDLFFDWQSFSCYMMNFIINSAYCCQYCHWNLTRILSNYHDSWIQGSSMLFVKLFSHYIISSSYISLLPNKAYDCLMGSEESHKTSTTQFMIERRGDL